MKDHNPPNGKRGDGGKENTNRHVYIEPGAQIDIVPELKKQHATERKEDRTAQDKQLMWTKIAAVLIATYTLVMIWQACLTRQSNKTNREAMTTVQRAFVYIDGYDALPIKDNSKPPNVLGIQLVIRIKNSGTTQAKRTRYHHNRAPYPLPPGYTFPDLDQNGNIVTDPIESNAFIAPQSTGELASVINFVRAEGQKTVVSYGWIKYHDVFMGTPEHITMFCNEVTVYYPSDPTETPVFNKIPCKQGRNCTDEECDQKQ